MSVISFIFSVSITQIYNYT